MSKGSEGAGARQPPWIAALAYLSGQAGVLLVGLFTFPLFTRLLSQHDYGLLSLLNTTLTLGGLVAGLGMPNAVVRFVPEYARQSEGERLRFQTSMLFGSVAVAACAAVILAVAGAASRSTGGMGELIDAFRWVAPLLVGRAASNIVLEYFRMSHRTGAYNALALGLRIGNAALAVAGFVWTRTLEGLLVGMVAGEGVATLAALAVCYRNGDWAWMRPAAAMLRQGVAFGAPMMLVGISGTVTAYNSRYLLQAFEGASNVAVYAVAYDLVMYVQALFVSAFRLSIMPELVIRYTNDGEEAAAEFAVRALRMFVWLLMGAGFGLVAVGGETLEVLASSKYAAAAGLLPVLTPAVLLSGLNFVFASGLYLRKRNDLWLVAAGIAAAVNVGLNLWLIPRHGAWGAAVAALAAYVLQCALTLAVAQRAMAIGFDWRSGLRTAVCGVAMLTAVGWMPRLTPAALSLAVKMGAGAAIYALLVLAVEPEARRMAAGALRRNWRTRWYLSKAQRLCWWLWSRWQARRVRPAALIEAEETGAWSAEERTEIERVARGLLEGRYGILSAGEAALGGEGVWMRHPFSGARLPAGLHPHDFENSADDIWVAMVLHSMPFLPWQAQAYRLSGDRAHLDAMYRLVRQWRTENGPLSGFGWVDGLTVGMRAVAMLTALPLAGKAPEDEQRLWTEILLYSGCILNQAAERPSFNHRMGEACALYYCGLAYAHTGFGREWMERAAGVLEGDLERQFFGDGVHAERCPGYHGFVLECLLHYRILGARAGRRFPAWWDERVRRAVDALAELSSAGRLAGFGDNSELRMLGLEAGPENAFALAGAVWPELAPPRSDKPLAARWLGAGGGHGAAAGISQSRLFGDSGFAVMRGRGAAMRWTGGRELTPRQGHSHADALSIELEIDGDCVLADRGTYYYLGDPAWRKYFRSTPAHNTATVDGCDQAVPVDGDRFGWKSYPAVTVEEWETGETFDRLTASHDGYVRLPGRPVHRRRIQYAKPDCWVIEDEVSGEGEHAVEVYWNFAPGEVRAEGRTAVVAERSWGRLELHVYEATGGTVETDLAVGACQPPRGWISSGYGLREAAPSWRAAVRGPLPLRLVTVIVANRSAEGARVRWDGEAVEVASGGRTYRLGACGREVAF